MTVTRKSAVVVLSYYRQPNFKEVLWGLKTENGRFLLGRLLRGIQIFVEYKTDLFILPGYSSRVMKKILEEKIEEIHNYIPKFDKKEKERLFLSLLLEENSKSTEEEIINIAKILKEHNVETVFLVTSPDHIARAIVLAESYFWKEMPYLKILGVPSQVKYSLNSSDEFDYGTIFEPRITEIMPSIKNLLKTVIESFRENKIEAIKYLDKKLSNFLKKLNKQEK